VEEINKNTEVKLYENQPYQTTIIISFIGMARYASGKPLAAFSTRLVRGNAFP
jgi:hypothetical protein